MCVVLALMPGAVAWENGLVKVEDGSDAAKSVFSSPDNVSPAPRGKSAMSGTSVEVISNNERSWRELSLPRPKNGISGRSRCRTEAVTCGIRYEPTSDAVPVELHVGHPADRPESFHRHAPLDAGREAAVRRLGDVPLVVQREAERDSAFGHDLADRRV